MAYSGANSRGNFQLEGTGGGGGVDRLVQQAGNRGGTNGYIRRRRMSGVNTLIGVLAVAAIGSFGARVILPAPSPIQVHSIAMVEGRVMQSRTITVDGPAFYAQWAATVADAETGESLIWCEGSGANAYPPGSKEVAFTLEDWTGSERCTLDSLPPGVYVLRASWQWGEKTTSKVSEPFEVK